MKYEKNLKTLRVLVWVFSAELVASLVLAFVNNSSMVDFAIAVISAIFLIYTLLRIRKLKSQ